MHCLVGCIALAAPRLALFLVWLFSSYLGEAYRTTIWPLLGFFFLPFTTLAYAFAWHLGPNGEFGLIGKAVIVLAFLMDLGIIGGNAGNKKVKKYYRKVEAE